MTLPTSPDNHHVIARNAATRQSPASMCHVAEMCLTLYREIAASGCALLAMTAVFVAGCGGLTLYGFLVRRWGQ